jgi:hypothetical protein
MMAGNSPRGSVDTYKAAGERISAVASLPPSAFIETIRDLRVAAAEARIASLSNLGEAWGWEPEFWAQDVKGSIASVKNEIASRESLPVELPEAQKLASWIGCLGHSLQAWPAIWLAALDLGPEFLERARIKS